MWVKIGDAFINLANVEFVAYDSKNNSASVTFVGSKSAIDDNFTLYDDDAKELLAKLEDFSQLPC